jgi:hypothetical protein
MTLIEEKIMHFFVNGVVSHYKGIKFEDLVTSKEHS